MKRFGAIALAGGLLLGSATTASAIQERRVESSERVQNEARVMRDETRTKAERIPGERSRGKKKGHAKHKHDHKNQKHRH